MSMFVRDCITDRWIAVSRISEIFSEPYRNNYVELWAELFDKDDDGSAITVQINECIPEDRVGEFISHIGKVERTLVVSGGEEW